MQEESVTESREEGKSSGAQQGFRAETLERGSRQRQEMSERARVQGFLPEGPELQAGGWTPTFSPLPPGSTGTPQRRAQAAWPVRSPGPRAGHEASPCCTYTPGKQWGQGA